MGLADERQKATRDSAPELVESFVTKRKALEALVGRRFERWFVAGSSSGAYFTAALALNGGIDADGFGAISGGALSARADFTKLSPRPFYVGYGTRDTVGPSARALGERLKQAGWPVLVSAHPVGHGAKEILPRRSLRVLARATAVIVKALCSLLAMASLLGCRSRPLEHSAPAPALSASSAPPLPASSAPAPLPPLEGVWLEELPLADGSVGYVAPPVGAREPRPLIVAVHGAGDRANWACGGWRLAASGYAFVVCPSGLPMGGERFGWDRGRTIHERVSLALAAVHARYARLHR